MQCIQGLSTTKRRYCYTHSISQTFEWSIAESERDTELQVQPIVFLCGWGWRKYKRNKESVWKKDSKENSYMSVAFREMCTCKGTLSEEDTQENI